MIAHCVANIIYRKWLNAVYQSQSYSGWSFLFLLLHFSLPDLVEISLSLKITKWDISTYHFLPIYRMQPMLGFSFSFFSLSYLYLFYLKLGMRLKNTQKGNFLFVSFGIKDKFFFGEIYPKSKSNNAILKFI